VSTKDAESEALVWAAI